MEHIKNLMIRYRGSTPQTYGVSYFRNHITELANWQVSDNVIERQQAMLLEYVRQQDICAHCQGFEKCGKEGDMQGFQQVLEPYGRDLSLSVQPCLPYQKYVVQRRVKQWEHISGELQLDKNFQLANFPPEQCQKYPRLFHYASEFADSFSVGDSAAGLYLFGPPGVGKTHLLLAVLNRLQERGIPCLFVRSDSVFDRMRHIIAANGDLEPLLETYATVPILGIDEFAQERANNFTLEKLFRIINHRFHAGLSTWFTSNYAPPNIYRKNGEDIHDSVAPLRSRVMQMTKLARMEGDDARQRGLESLT
ncbi:cell division protein ZapE [Alicyclobacillaceae bacterium I2511]|nr:cell division protein ZapE [Alicyclobacillaceae bacterium I2511]